MIAIFLFSVSFCREIHRIFALYIIYIEKKRAKYLVIRNKKRTFAVN